MVLQETEQSEVYETTLLLASLQAGATETDVDFVELGLGYQCRWCLKNAHAFVAVQRPSKPVDALIAHPALYRRPRVTALVGRLVGNSALTGTSHAFDALESLYIVCHNIRIGGIGDLKSILLRYGSGRTHAADSNDRQADNPSRDKFHMTLPFPDLT